MIIFAMKVFLLMGLIIWSFVDAQSNDSPNSLINNAPTIPSIWFNSIYPYPTKADKWSSKYYIFIFFFLC